MQVKAVRGALVMKGASQSYALSGNDVNDELELEENQFENQFELLPGFARIAKETIFEQG